MTNDINTLTTHLETTLTTPQSTDTLDHQADLLNQLFTAIITDKVASRLDTCDRYPDATMARTALALRIQKQCSDTIKTRGALDYMNGLNNRMRLPHPRKIEKQKEGS